MNGNHHQPVVKDGTARDLFIRRKIPGSSWVNEAEQCVLSTNPKTKKIKTLFPSMNKTEAKQIHPQVEHLHKEARELRRRERFMEEENRNLTRVAHESEQMLDVLEARAAQMLEDGLLKMSESDAKLMHALREEYRRLLHHRKLKRKEFKELQHSSDYLRMMEQRVMQFNIDRDRRKRI